MYDLSCTSNHPLEGSLLDFLKQLFFFICKKLVVILFLSKPNFIHVNLLLLHMPCLLQNLANQEQQLFLKETVFAFKSVVSYHFTTLEWLLQTKELGVEQGMSFHLPSAWRWIQSSFSSQFVYLRVVPSDQAKVFLLPLPTLLAPRKPSPFIYRLATNLFSCSE